MNRQNKQGTYVGVRFSSDSLDKIKSIQDKLKLYKPVPLEKLHSTVVFSREKVPYNVETRPAKATTGKLDVFATATGKRALVMHLDSEYLTNRHEYGKVLGATWDYPDYNPHVTLSYDIGARNIKDIIEPVELDIETEYLEDLDLEWSGE